MSGTEYFDAVAPEWDRMRSEFFPPAVREKAYARAGLAPGQTVADVGAGSGFISEGLLGRGLRIIAVEPSGPMLAELARKLGATGEVEPRRGEAERLPLRDGGLDCLFANMVLHHVEHPARAVAEMARTLKPGGRLVLTDLVRHDHAFLREEHHDRWLGFEPVDVQGWLEGAGLRRVTVEDLGVD